MNLCKNGHDRDVVGVTPQRQCVQCKRDSNRIQQRARRAGRKARPYRKSVPVITPVSDGLEPEYGPVPVPVSDDAWFDRVIVDRVLTGHRSGRRPYPLEQREIVRRMTPIHVQVDLADLCGVDRTTFNTWVSQYA